jgi:4'-phosphopantetheinyl transferase
MDVYWLEQSKTDLPEHNDWLSAGDIDRMNSMRFEKRRADWRLGRWTAKQAVAAYLNLPAHSRSLSEIEIRPAPSGAPDVFLANDPAEVSISISHRAGIAICAVALSGAAVGCDLEIAEPRIDSFITDYFTAAEQELVAKASAANRFKLLALLWSAKESALKAMRVGLRIDTRCLAVTPWLAHDDGHAEGRDQGKRHSEADSALALQPSFASRDWHRLQVHVVAGQVFQGWWQHAHGIVRTTVATPSPFQPISLLEEDHVLSAHALKL